MKTIAFHNLGCKVNSYELDVMQQFMLEKGYKIVPFDQIADIYVVNTCTVTNIADRKSRQMLHRAKQKNPKAIVVAVGCYVQTDLEGVKKDPCIDLAIGNNRKKDIAAILEEYLGRGENRSEGKTLEDTTVLDIECVKDYEEMTLKSTAEHTRAYVKIQDGCNQFCAYCAIPLARGRVRSRHPQDVLREVRGMVEAGYREIVLTGIHVSSYGIDLKDEEWNAEIENGTGNAVRERMEDKEAEKDYRGRSKLVELIEMVHDVPGLERIRIGSLEPRIVTAESAGKLASMPKVCPHFHLSLQSGCDDTLKRMNRHYTTEQYLESVKALRQAYAPELPAITTDVIVGFPGETEEEFAQSKAFLKEVGFYEMHVFKYSKRKGTRAASMKEQVPEPLKAERSDVLLTLEKEQSKTFRGKYLGKTAEVLFEEVKEMDGREYLIGHTRDYVKVAVPALSTKLHANDVAALQIKDFLTEDVLLGYESDLF